MMRRHNTRHAWALWDTIALTLLESVLRHTDRVIAHYGLGQDDPPTPEARADWIEGMIDEARALGGETPQTSPTLFAFEWLATADKRKQAGFYVDYGGSTWTSPADADYHTWTRGLALTRELVQARSALIERVLGMRTSERQHLRTSLEAAYQRYLHARASR